MAESRVEHLIRCLGCGVEFKLAHGISELIHPGCPGAQGAEVHTPSSMATAEVEAAPADEPQTPGAEATEGGGPGEDGDAPAIPVVTTADAGFVPMAVAPEEAAPAEPVSPAEDQVSPPDETGADPAPEAPQAPPEAPEAPVQPDESTAPEAAAEQQDESLPTDLPAPEGADPAEESAPAEPVPATDPTAPAEG